MFICNSIYCTHNKKRRCTLANIRLDKAGMCEQCIFERDFETVQLVREVGQALIKFNKKKAMRSGSSM